MDELMSLLPPTDGALLWIVALTAIALAYTAFTLVGFGSAMIASGPLSLVIPVAKVIPLLAMLDFLGAASRGWKNRKEVAWHEFGQLFPGMLLGQLLGVQVLARLPATAMAVGLGLFVMIQGLKGLRRKPAAPPPSRRAFVQGLLGGMLGGLFGSGGFMYAAYLERRLPSRNAFRATQAVLIALSTAWRIVLCLWAGLIDAGLFMATLGLVPAMAIGVYAGHHIDLRISREQLFGLLNILLVACGMSLILRHLF